MVALARSVSINARIVIMDEPTSSLEAREVETLFSVVSLLREQGIAIVYVSHRMDEIYRVAERVVVLRDGAVVHVGELAELPRVELVSLMLGRSVEKVKRGGATAFGQTHASTAPPVLIAEDLSRRHQIDGVAIQIRPGEVVGLGGLLGSGRSETLKAMAGVMQLDRGRVTVDGKLVRSGSVPAAIRAGIVMLPEDRKVEGITKKETDKKGGETEQEKPKKQLLRDDDAVKAVVCSGVAALPTWDAAAASVALSGAAIIKSSDRGVALPQRPQSPQPLAQLLLAAVVQHAQEAVAQQLQHCGQ
ncbi:MAG: hypothetical protein WDW36_009032 [Sanguina aurantia]